MVGFLFACEWRTLSTSPRQSASIWFFTPRNLISITLLAIGQRLLGKGRIGGQIDLRHDSGRCPELFGFVCCLWRNLLHPAAKRNEASPTGSAYRGIGRSQTKPRQWPTSRKTRLSARSTQRNCRPASILVLRPGGSQFGQLGASQFGIAQLEVHLIAHESPVIGDRLVCFQAQPRFGVHGLARLDSHLK